MNEPHPFRESAVKSSYLRGPSTHESLLLRFAGIAQSHAISENKSLQRPPGWVVAFDRVAEVQIVDVYPVWYPIIDWRTCYLADGSTMSLALSLFPGATLRFRGRCALPSASKLLFNASIELTTVCGRGPT
jgi:hypothetical protein